jgi:SAM-dependent methyltransferase/methyltransferase-like protein
MPIPRNPYNEVRYTGHARVFAHPRRMRTLARLFGLRAPAPERCRVLELGCGDATHLLWVAAGLREARCVGIDLTEAGLARGREMAQEAGIGNVELRQADIMDLDASVGEFDYVVAHGVYSWVPEPVRSKLLDLCARCLAPDGVALVSYNAMPGGHFRSLAGELMRFGTRGIADPERKVAQARRFLDTFSRWQGQGQGEGYAEIIRGQIARLEKTPDYVLYHDDLAEHTRAFSLSGFLERAGACGLRYLTEASFADTRYEGVPPEVQAEVAAAESSREDREQILDYLSGRAFRRTLLCRAAVALDGAPDAEAVAEMAVHGRFRPLAEAGLGDDAPLEFEGADGKRITVAHRLVKAALVLLGESWPRPLAFSDLLDRARSRCVRASTDAEEARRQFCRFLLGAYAGGVVDLNLDPPRVGARAGDRPRAFALARTQAARGAELTSVPGFTVDMDDPFSRQLLRLLDGSRDRAGIAASLVAAVERGEVALPQALSEAPDWRAALRGGLDENLASLARLGLIED